MAGPVSESYIAFGVPATELSFRSSCSSSQVIPIKQAIFFRFFYDDNYAILLNAGT